MYVCMYFFNKIFRFLFFFKNMCLLAVPTTFFTDAALKEKTKEQKGEKSFVHATVLSGHQILFVECFCWETVKHCSFR